MLEPGGSLHLLDFERPEVGGRFASWLHSSDHLRDNYEPRLLHFFDMRDLNLQVDADDELGDVAGKL